MKNVQNCGWYTKPVGGAEHSSVTLMSRCIAPWLLRFQHTCCASHLCGKIKMKVKPLVASMYGCEVPINDAIHAHNRKLVEELKAEYAFLYKVCQSYAHPSTVCCDLMLYRHAGTMNTLNWVYTSTKSFKLPSTFASSRATQTLVCNLTNCSAHFHVLHLCWYLPL